MWVYQEKAGAPETARPASGGSGDGRETAALRFSDELGGGAPSGRARAEAIAPARPSVQPQDGQAGSVPRPERQRRPAAFAPAASAARQARAQPADGSPAATVWENPALGAADRPAARRGESSAPAASPAPTIQTSGPAPRRSSGQATRDCLLLAAAYLFGTALSGVMQSLCEAKELDILSYYLKSWAELFTLRDAGSALALFSAQYCSAMGAVTLLLVFGLCAFGPVLIFLFTMLYGVGTGIISLQLFLQNTLPRYAAYLFFWGVPAAAMAVCLCFFGSTALQVSVRLQNTAFGRRRSVPVASSARLLLGQYILIGILLLPVCGVAAALLYLLAGV